MPSEVHRLDRQRESVAAPSVTVGPGPSHCLNEARGEPFQSLCSVYGHAFSLAFNGEIAGSLSIPKNPITILVSVL